MSLFQAITIFLLHTEYTINLLKMATAHSRSGKLIAVIGDEDTCTGFLLGGIGELNKQRQPNFMVVEKDTSTQDIEEQLKYGHIHVFDNHVEYSML